MQKITDRDMRILFELDKNARQSYNVLGRTVRLSKETVRYRVKQLEELGILKGYYALIDFSKLGYILIRVYLRLQNTTPEIEREIVGFLSNEKNLLTVYKAEVRWDLAFGLLVTDIREFHEIYDRFKLKYRKFMLEDRISVFYEYVNYYNNYLVAEKFRDFTPLVVGNSERISVDNIDLDILKAIAENARIALIELAKKTNLTPMAIKYRIKQFEKKRIILAYRAMIDYSKLGYEYYKLDLFIEDFKMLPQLEYFVKQNANVVYMNRTVGGSDLEFDVCVKNIGELYMLVEKMKTKFPSLLKTFDFYRAAKIFKYDYFPEI